MKSFRQYLTELVKKPKVTTQWALGIVFPDEVKLRTFADSEAMSRVEHETAWPHNMRPLDTHFHFKAGDLQFDETPTRDTFFRAVTALERAGAVIETFSTIYDHRFNGKPIDLVPERLQECLKTLLEFETAAVLDAPEVVTRQKNPLGLGLVTRAGEVRWVQRDYADSMWSLYHSDQFGAMADRTPSSGHFRAYEGDLIFDDTPSQDEYFKALDAAEKHGFTITHIKTSLAGSRRERANFDPRALAMESRGSK